MKKLYINLFNKKNFFYNQCFIFLLTASLFDLYYYKIGRIFDYFGFLILLSLLIYFYLSKKINLKKHIYELKFQFIIFAYFLIPYFISFDSRLGIGMAFFLFSIFMLFLIININNTFIDTVVKIAPKILLIHLIFFYSQFFLFKFLDIYIDFTNLLFSNPSRNGWDTFFRPSGLFQEPNSFCLFTIIFLTILSCQGFNKINKIILFLSIYAILISNSLWGYFAVVIIFFGLLLEKKFKLLSIFFLICLISQNIWLLHNTKLRIFKTNKDLTVLFKDNKSEVLKIIDNEKKKDGKKKKFFTESSGNERLLGAEVRDKITNHEKFYNYDPNLVEKLKSKCSEPFYNLFGCGYNNFGYQFIHGVNAFSFLKVNLGLFGFIYFIFGIFLILKEKSYYNIIFILLIFTSAPIFTYLIFSLFIAIMFNRKIFNKIKTF